MTVPGGLAESVAETLVRLMIVEVTGVDTGYIGRFAALGTAGDPQATRAVEARLTDDARCLEASVRAELSEVANVAPAQLRPGLRPKSTPEVLSQWQELIERVLASGRVRPAELNAFVAEFADTADDGDKLLAVLTELETCRRTMWHNNSRPTVLPTRDLERLRELEVKRQRIWAQIRGRNPVTVRTERVQSALERRYEVQRAELVAALEQCTSAEDRAGYAAALDQLDSAHELALRRQSVPRHGVQPASPAAVGPMATAAGALQQSVLAQLENQRAQLVGLRDQDRTAEGRAGYEQAIAQLDVNLEMLRQQQAHLAAQPVDATAMTDEQRRATDNAIADVARATAQLQELEVAAGAAMRAGSELAADFIEQQNQMAGLNAEFGAANDELSKALRAEQNAQFAVDNARRTGTHADHQAAVRHHEQAQQRHAAVKARVADLQARLEAMRAQEQQWGHRATW